MMEQTIGPYEIIAKLGAGGMGEVYRARDARLHREVALKVLPESMAADPERLRRFEREAQVLAALNHQNIAAIYGLEGRALVMEFVEGEMPSGPMPVEEAVPIAKQIAEALEYAHEKGIVHRDLKPANIKITPQGQVKVLDFGLAKALSDSPAAGDLSNSPTLSIAATRAGMILGTAAYMSPEQAKGREADRRADIWAFGVVLLELLTGQRAFPGDNVSEVMAGVILKEPEIPAGLPPHLERLLRRCLTKDPRQRLQAIGEARIMLEDQSLAAPPSATGQRAGWKPAPLAPWVAAGVLGIGMLIVLSLWAPWRPSRKEPVRKTTIELGGDVVLHQTGSPLLPSLALSPDGALLAFVGGKSAQARSQLYLRRLDQLKAGPMSGTEGAKTPFFSPDSQWIAFFAEGKLKKVSSTGGAPVTLCDAPDPVGGSWSEDGTIFFAPDRYSALVRVSAAGGLPEKFAKLDPGSGVNAHRWPQALPGGRAVLFNAGTALNFGESNLVVQVVGTGETKVVQRGGYHGRYLPTGHLVFINESTLFMAPFNLARLETTGQPVPVLENVTSQPSGGGAQFSFSNDGTLVYLPGTGLAVGSQQLLSWIDRQGKTTALRQEPAFYGAFRFSPDGSSLAISMFEGKGFDFWVYHWERGILSRLTAEGSSTASTPVWTTDGRRVTYRSRGRQRGEPTIYWRAADGTGEPQRLTDGTNAPVPTSWHPSGKFLAFIERLSIMILPMEGDEVSGWKPGKPYDFVRNEFANYNAVFSPDGRWLAYQSNETGRAEVYVRPFPGPGGRWQVSSDGGTFPAWSRAAGELLFLGADNRIMAAGYSVSGEVFKVDKPRPWPEVQPVGVQNFDPHPDGKRIAITTAQDQKSETKADHLVLVENFFEELRRLAPAKK